MLTNNNRSTGLSFTVLLLSVVIQQASAHGRLVTPMPRILNLGYENDPVTDPTNKISPLRATDSKQWVCRHDSATPSQATYKAGSVANFDYRLTARHVGDCDFSISYDINEPLTDMRWFKIANIPDCKHAGDMVPEEKSQYEVNRVSVTLPSWLKSGKAVLRWGWWGLHNWPSVEFFVQCSDITIEGEANLPSEIQTFQIPGLYPKDANEGKGYRNEWAEEKWETKKYWMTGPSCAMDSKLNHCELTAVGTKGNIPIDSNPTSTSTTSTSTSTSTSTTSTSTTRPLPTTTTPYCPSGKYISISADMTNDHCQALCSHKEADICPWQSCACKPATTSNAVNLIGYYGNSGACDTQGCIPDFDEIPAAYNVIIVTFLNYGAGDKLEFQCSSRAPVQESNLADKVAAWKKKADPWGRKKMVLASLGGQNGRWPVTISDHQVIQQLGDWMRQHNINGLDLDFESGTIKAVQQNIGAFRALKAEGFVLSAAPEAAQGPLSAYRAILADLDWVHPQFYNNPPSAVTVPFVPKYETHANWQDPADMPWWLVTMDTTANLVGMKPNQRGIAIPATPLAAGSQNHWDLNLLAAQVRVGDIRNVATWALGYDKMNSWELAVIITKLNNQDPTSTSTSTSHPPNPTPSTTSSTCHDKKSTAECLEADQDWGMCKNGGSWWIHQCQKTCNACKQESLVSDSGVGLLVLNSANASLM